MQDLQNSVLVNSNYFRRVRALTRVMRKTKWVLGEGDILFRLGFSDDEIALILHAAGAADFADCESIYLISQKAKMRRILLHAANLHAS